MKKYGRIFLVPTPIGDTAINLVLPSGNRDVVRKIDYFVVENIRTARRFLSRYGLDRPFDEIEFRELNEHTRPEDLPDLLSPVQEGKDTGILSEAGVPAVADPGSDLVALVHSYGIEVVPMVGPSSVLLAVMASGLNGQSFAFNGYLPVKQPERNQAIRFFEGRAWKEGQSQLFIETPYRNLKLLEDILTVCREQTLLTIAADLLQENQYIRTLSVRQWKKKKPDIHKRPAIFIIGKM